MEEIKLNNKIFTTALVSNKGSNKKISFYNPKSLVLSEMWNFSILTPDENKISQFLEGSSPIMVSKAVVKSCKKVSIIKDPVSMTLDELLEYFYSVGFKVALGVEEKSLSYDSKLFRSTLITISKDLADLGISLPK